MRTSCMNMSDLRGIAFGAASDVSGRSLVKVHLHENKRGVIGASAVNGFIEDRSTPPIAIRAEWITSEDQFRELGVEWLGLFERAGRENAFLSFEWMYTWWTHWG